MCEIMGEGGGALKSMFIQHQYKCVHRTTLNFGVRQRALSHLSGLSGDMVLINVPVKDIVMSLTNGRY